MNKSDTIYDGLKSQNEPAEYQGQKGFWVQGDCVFFAAETPQGAINQYRQNLSIARIAINHNYGCASIRALQKYVVGERIRKEAEKNAPSLPA